MRRIALAMSLLMTIVLVSTAERCLPLAAWTAEGYTVDASRSSRAASVVGHCFRLRVDADIRSFRNHIELRDGGAVDVSGRVWVLVPGSSPHRPISLPKGSRIVVERVLAWRNVETSSFKPYIRIDNALIDADDLFRDTGKGEGPPRLTYIDRLLEPCDASE